MTEIVETVAGYENTSPDQLPALADDVDPETYQRLLATGDELSEPLTFEYLWYDVTVLPDRGIVVTP